jgi:zinc transport system ATP-binding protein
MNSILSVSNLNFKYNAVEVLKDISFDVYPGDYIGLVGNNGSGKTTLVKVILGLLKPYTGSISLFGQVPEQFHGWDKVGYMPQNLSLFNPIFPATVEEVISLGILSKKRFPKRINDRDKKTVSEVLDRLEITNLKDQLVGKLSGGQQQRIFLAQAIITKPEILILDEPGNSLDPAANERFFSILDDMNKNHKTTIILITHDIGQIGEYANKLLYINQKIIFYGSFVDFCKSPEISKLFGVNTQHIICHQHN